VRPTDVDAKKAMDVAATSAGLNIAGMSLDAVYWHTRFDIVPPWHLGSLGFSIALLLYLGLRRTRPPPPRVSAMAFILNNVVIATALWFADSMSAFLPRQSATFQPQKLGALAVAILAPPNARAALLSIALFVGPPIVRYELFDLETKAHLSSEPWAMTAYGIFAVGLYFYRIQSRKVRAEMQRAITEATSLERLSCVLLAFRDFYNTPLQTLELTVAIFRLRHPEDRNLVARMERATDRLAELNRIASSYEPPVCGSHRVSLDPAEVLRRRGRPVA
jgi:hypothetical protein